MWAQSVVLPSRTIGLHLRLWGCGELLIVGEFIPEAAVEGLCESFFTGRSRRDLGRVFVSAGFTSTL